MVAVFRIIFVVALEVQFHILTCFKISDVLGTFNSGLHPSCLPKSQPPTHFELGHCFTCSYSDGLSLDKGDSLNATWPSKVACVPTILSLVLDTAHISRGSPEAY